MNTTNSNTLDWALWFYWIMATTLGWLVGFLLFRGIPLIISGVAISALQWSVLHRRIHQAWRWAVFSSLGWMGGYILFAVSIPQDMGFLLGPVMGGVVGLVQWFLLRREVNSAGWWIVFSVLGWTTGLTLMPGLLTSGSLPGVWTGLALMVLFKYSSPELRK